jgi:hypothetical protein
LRGPREPSQRAQADDDVRAQLVFIGRLGQVGVRAHVAALGDVRCAIECREEDEVCCRPFPGTLRQISGPSIPGVIQSRIATEGASSFRSAAPAAGRGVHVKPRHPLPREFGRTAISVARETPDGEQMLVTRPVLRRLSILERTAPPKYERFTVWDSIIVTAIKTAKSAGSMVTRSCAPSGQFMARHSRQASNQVRCSPMRSQRWTSLRSTTW